MERMLDVQGKPSPSRRKAAALAAVGAFAALGIGIGCAVVNEWTFVAVITATVAPFLVAILLARPTLGLYGLVFMAPYVDVFKTTSLGVTFRFSEIFGAFLLVVAIMHVLRSGRRLHISITDVFVLGLLASMVISVVANLGNEPSQERLRNIPTAWIGVTGVLDEPAMAIYKKIVHSLVAFAIYFAVNYLATTWRVWLKAVKTLIITAMLVCVWALINLVGFMGGMATGLGVRASNVWYAGNAPRITGTLSEPSYFANFLVLVIPITFFSYARRRAAIGQAEGVLLGAKWDLIALVLLCVTLLFTFSGGGWVVFAVQLWLLFAVCLRNNLPMKRFGTMVAALVFLVVLGLLAAALFTDMDYADLAEDNWQKFRGIFEVGVGSGRRVAPDVGWMMFCDHPLFGVGPGRFSAFEYDYLLNVGFVGEDTPASTFYARIMGELGILGMAMVIGIFASLTWRCFRWARRARRPTMQTVLWGAGVGAVTIAVHYLAHANFWWPYVWVVFGLANSGIRLTRSSRLDEGANPGGGE